MVPGSEDVKLGPDRARRGPQNYALAAVVMLLTGCSNGNTTADTPLDVGVGIATAALVNRAATLALDAVSGTPRPCVTVTKACGGTFPCDGAATIAFAAGCPLPLGGEVTGSVTLTGAWASATKAVLTAEFTSVKTSTSKEAAIAKATAIAVERQTDAITVGFSSKSATPRVGALPIMLGSGAAWEMSTNTQGTADLSDDELTINAIPENTTDLTSHALDFSGVIVSGGCTKNPTSGTGTFTGLSGGIDPSPKVVTFDFHSTCDGLVSFDGKSQPMILFPK